MPTSFSIFGCHHTDFQFAADIIISAIIIKLVFYTDTKGLRELESDGLISRKQYSTIPPTVEYSLTEKGKTLIPALDTLYQWADDQMKAK